MDRSSSLCPGGSDKMCNELCRDVRVTGVVTARFDTSTYSLTITQLINLNSHIDAAAEGLAKDFKAVLLSYWCVQCFL